MRVRAAVVVACALLIVIGCEGDVGGPSAAERNDSVNLSAVIDDCETQIIPDPECNTEDSGSGTSYSTYFPELVADVGMQSSVYGVDSETAPCPRWITGSTTARVRDPNTGYDYEFNSSGTWTINWVKSLVYLLSGQAVYNWPAGSWPAFNLDRPTGIASVTVESARAVCAGPGSLHFIVFYGVKVTDSGLSMAMNGGSGGGGGNGNCHTEYIVVEINYGDGTGWHTLWEGYATVCE